MSPPISPAFQRAADQSLPAVDAVKEAELAAIACRSVAKSSNPTTLSKAYIDAFSRLPKTRDKGTGAFELSITSCRDDRRVSLAVGILKKYFNNAEEVPAELLNVDWRSITSAGDLRHADILFRYVDGTPGMQGDPASKAMQDLLGDKLSTLRIGAQDTACVPPALP